MFETFAVYISERFDESKLHHSPNSIFSHRLLRFSDVRFSARFHFRIERTRLKIKDSGIAARLFRKFFLSFGKTNAPADYSVISFDNFFQRFNVKRVFVFQNFLRQTFRRLFLNNFDRFLQNNRAVI